jgi:hypothetical protein
VATATLVIADTSAVVSNSLSDGVLEVIRTEALEGSDAD